MPVASRFARFDDAETQSSSWLDRAAVHVNTPLYPSFQESSFSADDGSDVGRCACPACSGASPSDPQFFMPPQNGVAGNGLPIYSYDQAAAQITRQSGGWGPGAVVTYGFRANEPGAMPGVTGFVPFNAAQIAMAIESLALWSEVANITFVRVADLGEYTNNATMLFSNYTSGADGASAFAYYPGGNANAGDVWINFSLDTNNSNLVEGAFGPHTMSHEIGHAIGLAHPANYDALDGVDPTYPESSVYWQDSRMYTVMSYFGSAGPGGSLGAFASGPQLHDVAAAQLLYGANMTTRAGNTVYGFNSNTGHAHFTISADEATPVFAIWDAGGNDTLDLSGYSSTVEIDLREEAFSSAGPGTNPAVNNGRAYGNISIARGAIIENGIGGSGGDTIIGNSVANRLTGNAGNDSITGGAAADTAVYSTSSTSASWVRNPDGSWTVTAGADGTDTVSSVEYLDFTDRDVFLDRAAQTFTGDGTSDLLLRNTNGTLSLWFVQGASITGTGVGTISADWSPQSGDFNGDGRDDILWRNLNNGSMSMWFMNGAAVTGVAFNSVATNWVIEGLGDFNGDTRDDILWRDSSTGAMSLWFLNGPSVSGGAFGTVGGGWIVEALGDFNGDGRDDILWRETSTGSMSMWFMNGQAVTGGAFGNVGAPWVVEGAGDFNGDGRDDIFWRNSSTGDVSLWFMNGQAVAGTAGFGLATTWQAEGLGDYNGDGRDDIIWRDNAGAMVAWFVNGASITGQSLGSLSTDWVINPGG